MAKVIDLIAESVQRRTRHITPANIGILKEFLEKNLDAAHRVESLTGNEQQLSEKGMKISRAIASYLDRNVVVNGVTFKLAEFLDNEEAKIKIIEKIDEVLGIRPRAVSAPPAPISEAKPVVEQTTASQTIASASSSADQVITPSLAFAPSPPVTIIGNIFRRFASPLSSSAPTAAPAGSNTSTQPIVTHQPTEPPATDIQATKVLEKAGYFR